MTEFFSKHADLIGVLFMPLTYGFVGWFTNWVALKMTFYPIKFWGIPPYLGWQGIIPRKAHKMANRAVDVITGRLIKIEEIFDKVDPVMIEKELKPMLKPVIRDLTKDIVDQIRPGLWPAIPDLVKNQIYAETEKQIPGAIKSIIMGIRKNVYQYFDLKGMVLKRLSGDNVVLVVELFQTVGGPEFRFIELSGLYFGFLLGLVQIGIWLAFPVWWTLPIQGVIVGYLTNWLALEMIFRPFYEKDYILFKYQGIFLKRQAAVAEQYSKFVATKILNARNILEEILYGRAADEVFALIKKAVIRSFENTSQLAHPIITVTMGSEKYLEIREEIVKRMSEVAPKSIEKIEKYVEKATDIEETMASRMKALPPEEFESILRSAFQEDELLLIIIGAVLGAMVGLGQAVYMIAFPG
ncbi:MAG TPA: DUF445 family protein [Leptospiraceae bacterium]|nr:DUF445 family protein [Leptospiraceae bacterium]HMW04367.1 DUF445 family protein [Leptospiraceae bacterium]HMX31063.1 DUF445 family protein [Leptospiraceae bacterium]HMY31879.1 DUF445 family protein [Leptospiraceae bacterium]HNA06306.1 DUF445 family protein [Leptospiraceae bacterium]